MNRDIIKRFVRTDSYNSFEIEGHIFPKLINGLSLQKHRDKLKLDISSYEGSFIYDVSILKGKAVSRRPLYHFIREFPIIIEDVELWKSLLTELGETREESYHTSYFMLDFYFPHSEFIVEIDSPFHNDKEIYDKSRDLYIQIKYGIKTIRFYEYGKDEDDREIYKGLFRAEIKEAYNRGKFLDPPETLDFSKSMIDSYIASNKSALLFIDSLIRYIGRIKFYSSSEILIGQEDLKKIFPKIFKGKNGKYIENDLFLSLCITVCRDLYKKKLKKKKEKM